jgi:hypothetical protein
MYLFYSDRCGAALGILALTPIVHPNGVVFFLAGVLFTFRVGGYKWREISAKGILIWLIVLAAWSIYGIHIMQHWNSFAYDMTQQMQRKIGRAFLKPMIDTKLLLLLLGIVIVGVYSWYKKDRWLLLLSSIAGASWMVNRIGQELWYGAYDVFAIILLLIALLSWAFRSNLRLVAAISFVVLLYGGYQLGAIENPIVNPREYNLVGLQMPDSIEYMKQSDVDRLRAYILSHRTSNNKIRVKFEPKGDALFFQTAQDSMIETIHAHLDMNMFPFQPHDLYIVHVSKYLPPVWKSYPIEWAFRNAGIDPNNKKYEIFRRDETEVWYANVSTDKNR